MRLLASLAAVVFGVAAMGMVGGCSSVDVQTRQELGLPAFAPSDPANVVILRGAPDRQHVRLGEVYAQPEGDPGVDEIEMKMRQAAAKMGADAVVIVSDRTRRMGTLVSGPWYNRQVSPQYQRYIVGVAIRYTPQ